MRKALILIVLAALGIALVAAGCGGDNDESTATTAALSKGEFIKQADAICQQGDKEINQAGREVFGEGQQPSQKEQDQFITDTVVPSVQKQIDGIRALTPPQGDEEQVTAILDAAQGAIDKAEQDPSALTQRGGSDPFAEANRLAKQYGLTKCG